MSDGADWTTYLVEHYWPGVTEAAFHRSARRVAASAECLARAGEPIRFLHSTLVPDDGAAFCVLAAATPDLVARAYAAAGVTFERLVVAIESEVHPGEVDAAHRFHARGRAAPRIGTGSDPRGRRSPRTGGEPPGRRGPRAHED